MNNILSVFIHNRSCLAKIILLVMLFFGVNLYLSFATDTYATFRGGFYGAGIDMVMRNGRPIIGLIYELHYLSGLSNISFYYISSVLALIFLGIAIWIYQGILETYKIKENIRILLAFAGIANVFIIEYFMFIEKCGFMLAVLFNVIGVYWIEKFFRKKKKRYFGLAIIAMILAIFTYQGTVALFVILSIPFAMKNAENFKDYLSKGLAIGIVYIIPVIVDLLAFKFIFKSLRMVGGVNYTATLREVIMGIGPQGIETFNLLPQYLFLIIAFVVFVSVVVWSVVCQKSLWRIFNACVIVLATCIFSAAPILQGSGWWLTRTVYPGASIIAVLAIDLFVNKEEVSVNECIKKTVQVTVLVAITVLLVTQYFSFNKIYIDKYRLNALDQYRYQYIYQEICNYQEATGTEIKKIAFYADARKSRTQYSNLYDTGDLVVSAFLTNWSDISAMNYYLQTHYEKIDPVKEYVIYFADKNWNSLSHEQLIFDGDTLHICVY